jgi:hypothetical protein
MFQENFEVTGKLHIVLTDENGNVKDEREVDNLVVQSGLNFIASRMKDATANVMSHMSVGTTSTTPTLSDTALGSEVSGSRVALTSTVVSGSNVTYTATFNPGVGTGALVEAGIFNAASSGTMLCRTTFAVINKNAADTLTISWTTTAS